MIIKNRKKTGCKNFCITDVHFLLKKHEKTRENREFASVRVIILMLTRTQL